MNTSQKGSFHSKTVEVVAAICLGVLAILAFVTQAVTVSNASPRETALFNLLQFILTTGFAWFSTRAISRQEFEGSLRRFAIGAYRRIADINILTNRLHNEVSSMISEAPTGESHQLRIVHAIVADTCQVVQSSIADWADVIGDELVAIQTINKLESEKEELTTAKIAQQNTPESDQIQKIDRQIAALTDKLPSQLKFGVNAENRRRRWESHAAQWFADQHTETNGLLLPVVTGDGYRHDRDYEELADGELLTSTKDEFGSLDVVDSGGRVLGRIQNKTPLDYPDFVRALEVCFGAGPLDLQLVGKRERERRRGKIYGWFYVAVRNRALVPTRSEKVASWRREEWAEKNKVDDK